MIRSEASSQAVTCFFRVACSKELEVSEARYQIIQGLVDNPNRTREDVTHAGKKTGVGTRTLYRWIRLYEAGGLSALAPRHDKKGHQTKRFPSEIEKGIEAVIK